MGGWWKGAVEVPKVQCCTTAPWRTPSPLLYQPVPPLPQPAGLQQCFSRTCMHLCLHIGPVDSLLPLTHLPVPPPSEKQDWFTKFAKAADTVGIPFCASVALVSTADGKAIQESTHHSG